MKVFGRWEFNSIGLLNTLVGISIMLFGRFAPPPSIVVPASEKLLNLGLPQVDGGVLLSITPMGMAMISLFVGVVYLWTAVDTLWPSFLGVLLLGMSGYMSMPQVLGKFMGNPMVVMIFFLFIFAAVLIKSNLSAYLAHWFMTRKIVQGKPWAFTGTILLATYCVAFFEQTSACFLMWPALYIIFDHAGFKKGDKYVSVMIVYTMVMALLCFATDPVKGGAFYLLSNMDNLAASSSDIAIVPINYAKYLFFGVCVSLVCIAAMLFAMRFIFRIDVSPIKNINMAEIEKDELPPMSIQQKIIILLFVFYAAWLLLPGIIGRDNIIGDFLAKNALGGTLLVTFILSFVHIGKKPIADIVETNSAYPWRTLFLIATAFLLGGSMTGQGTNVTLFMEYLLRDYLSGLNGVMLTVAVIVIGILVTNFFNSVVAGLVLTPVLLAICQAFQLDASPVIVCFFYIVLVAAATPAASPFAAILYDNTQWVAKKDVAFHAALASAIVVCVLIVAGIPLARFLF
ncbi:SLC13 family permease [Oceanidesulfovibrio marinus]|uniref:Citrate transporter-like domain-containing protein n=1 Tax=Oceanidesulfovibrio marinus TaxID=370038 RepID=A0ABX6NJJ4_9BACT|nr:SLC13 family permease [Oceanidesulfovibrio marinus]QJT09820.1 hypothetical protein E8L03_13120 [Oceanidesulfovibrio marinus]